MRYGIVVLMLFAALPLLYVPYVPAAPAPEPYAILEIEAPPGEGSPEALKGQTADEYRKQRINVINSFSGDICHDPEIRKLPSIAALKEPWKWTSKNLRITREGEGNRLRIMCRDGNRTERVAIINSLLRVYLKEVKEEGRLKWWEDALSRYENILMDLEKDLGKDRDAFAVQRKSINNLRSDLIPNCRADIARYKQIAVIKWAK